MAVAPGLLNRLDLDSLNLYGMGQGGPQGGAGGPPPPGLMQGGPPPAAPPSAPPQAPMSLDPSTTFGYNAPGGPPQPDPNGLLDPATLQTGPQGGGGQPAPPQGFLGKLTAPDPDGVTFRDKLMALGSILKGDTDGGQKTLEAARTRTTALRTQQLGLAKSQMQAQAFAAAFDKDGKFHADWYAKAMGPAYDATDMGNMVKAYAPHFDVSREGAGIVGHPDTGTMDQLINPPAPAIKAPGKLILKPGGDPNNPTDWVPNEALTSFTEQDAAARRKGAPLAPRAAPKAKSYGANEVNWGG